MQKKIDLLVLGLNNEIDNLLDLRDFGVIDILPEIEGLTPLLYLQLTSYCIGCIVEFNLEVVHQ